jgi:hypothetical protein
MEVAVENRDYLAARLKNRSNLGAILHERFVRSSLKPIAPGKVLIADGMVHEHKGFALCTREVRRKPLNLISFNDHTRMVEVSGVQKHTVVVAHIKGVVELLTV